MTFLILIINRNLIIYCIVSFYKTISKKIRELVSSSCLEIFDIFTFIFLHFYIFNATRIKLCWIVEEIQW